MSHSAFLANEPSFYPDSSLEIRDEASGMLPFANAEAAWFWCVRISDAIHSGGRLAPWASAVTCPCEAVDIQKVVLRLADTRLLNDRHVDALVTYGKRQIRPSRPLPSFYWQQAMQRLTPILQQKGIIA